MSWEGFKYEPVRGLIERVQRRILRTQRKNMLRMFINKGLLDLVARTKTLRDNSSLWCGRKIAQFQRIHNDYIKLVVTAEVPEAPPAAA